MTWNIKFVHCIEILRPTTFPINSSDFDNAKVICAIIHWWLMNRKTLSFTSHLLRHQQLSFGISCVGENGGNVHTGGNAHKVAVLSADVLRKENSDGCHRAEMTLSEWEATTTLGRGMVKSPGIKQSLYGREVLNDAKICFIEHDGKFSTLSTFAHSEFLY